MRTSEAVPVVRGKALVMIKKSKDGYDIVDGNKAVIHQCEDLKTATFIVKEINRDYRIIYLNQTNENN